MTKFRKQYGSSDNEAIKKGLILAGIPESQIDTSRLALVGYSTDVGPIAITPLAIIGVRQHTDVEKSCKFAFQNYIPITARGAGSGLPAQSVGSGIILDMRSLDQMRMIGDHPQGGKQVLVQSGVICTRLNNFLKEFGLFMASYPASTDMATIGGMIANNSSGANSCKLGQTQHQILDLHIVLSDGSSLWTTEIESNKYPWNKILELIKANKDIIEKNFPRVPKNSSGYNILDILEQIKAGITVDWARLFAHSEGTLGIITEAKIRALPLPNQKATCVVYFTDLQQACNSIPEIYNLAPSCFDMAITTNLDLINKNDPGLNIPKDAKVMYIIEFDDLEISTDPHDPTKRIGHVCIGEKQIAGEVIQRQVENLRKLLDIDYPKTAIGFEVSRDPSRQDALWKGRRNALQVLYSYGQGKRPLTMIECVVLPRDETKLAEFIKYMETVFSEDQVVAGTHGHAGDCNFHIYLLLNLSQRQDREKLIRVMTKITQKVIDLGGSMSGEHADGRTRGIILPYVFGTQLFDLFVEIKNLMDPRATLHPEVKIIPESRNKGLSRVIEELVGIEEKDSHLDITRFKDFNLLYSGICSFCSQCADICPIFNRLQNEFVSRTEAAPTFKRVIATAFEKNGNLAAFKNDPLFKKVFELCLLCGQCTWKCPTSASMRDMVAKVREEKRSKIIAPAMEKLISNRLLYNAVIETAGISQAVWRNKMSRKAISWLPQSIFPIHVPYARYIPPIARSTIESRYREFVNIPSSKSDIAYFYGCSSDFLDMPVVDSFMNIAKHNGWKVSLPPQRCCGEPFAAAGNLEEYRRLARYNIDHLSSYRYIIAHCPSCILAFQEYAKDFARIKDDVYENKAKDIVGRLWDPARFIMEVIGPNNLRLGNNIIKRKFALHVSCHEKLGHKIAGTTNYTLGLLNLVPGLVKVDMKGSAECCGQGGPWGLLDHYDLSVNMRNDKIINIIDSKTDVVTSWCLGCVIQMKDGLNQAGSKIEVRHPLELLSEMYTNFN
jgi:FAD/FMN-containing dehydrogenase/Fe-S oxidoreductase